MSLTGRQKRYLKGLAHNRKAIVSIGSKGLSDSVLAEIREALAIHELLKIKLPPLPRAERDRMLQAVTAATGAEAIQAIGHIGVLYRAADPCRIELPD